MTTRLASLVGSRPFLRRISRVTTASEPSGDMIATVCPRSWAIDLIFGKAIKSHPGLSWRTARIFTGTLRATAANGAAGVGEKIYLTSQRRADGDLAADAQKLDVDPFFLVVAFFVGDDQTDHRCRKRGMRDADVVDRLSRTGCK